MSESQETIYSEETYQNALDRIKLCGMTHEEAQAVIVLCAQQDAMKQSGSRVLETVISILEKDKEKGEQLSESELLAVLVEKEMAFATVGQIDKIVPKPSRAAYRNGLSKKQYKMRQKQERLERKRKKKNAKH